MSAVLIADKLRASLLQAAIQGKLTKQLPEDGDARNLLKEIEAEKARLIEEKVIRKEKPLPPIIEDEIPFEIPENWVWQKLSIISYTVAPKSYQILARDILDQGLYPVVSQSQNYIDGYANDKDKVFTNVPIIIFGDHTKVIKLVDFPFIVGADGTKLIKPLIIDIRYLEVVLQYHRINMHDRGYSRHFQFIKGSLVPIPPLAEQKRIVEAIETALAKIDKLKTDETKLYDIQKAFPNKLRAALLQSAIQGQLTEQLPEDGDARDLLKEIEAEKTRLIEEKVIRKAKPLPPITEDETPFEIPENWVWVRFNDIVHFNLGKTPPRADAKYWGKGFPWVSISDLLDGEIITETKEEISYQGKDKAFSNIMISPKGTLLMSFKLTIGKVSVLGMDAYHNEAIISIYPFKDDELNIVRDFLKLFLPSISLSGNFNNAIKGSTLNKKSLSELMIPLPPLAEQQRIVEKLDDILGKVDELKRIAE